MCILDRCYTCPDRRSLDATRTENIKNSSTVITATNSTHTRLRSNDISKSDRLSHSGCINHAKGGVEEGVIVVTHPHCYVP